MRSISMIAALAFASACAGGYKQAASPGDAVAYGPTPPARAPQSTTAYGPQRAPEPVVTPTERPGLGTEWGETVTAPVSFAPFTRQSNQPYAEVALHYNDSEGVRAHANYLGASLSPLEVFVGDGALGLAIVDEAGRTLPGFTANGKTLVMGEDGARYRLVVRNGTGARFEIVASVDGLDVIDGKPADPNRRGYILDPHGVLVIDGFRTNDAEVAAFRFGKVADSYAAQTSGDRNVGVVGFAIFPERGAVWTHGELARRDSANPFPSRGYATPPR